VRLRTDKELRAKRSSKLYENTTLCQHSAKATTMKAAIGNVRANDGNVIARALLATTVYFLILFSLGFALGTVRVMVVAPRVGVLVATVMEVPVMLVAAYLICPWVILRWRVARRTAIRWAMVLWFLVLLFLFESVLGLVLFGRTMAEQWESLKGTAGLIGLFAQIIVAFLPVFLRKGA
jgi:hypothetical protein